MARKSGNWTVVALMGGAAVVLAGAASAQPAQTVLAALSKNMGADNLKCISYGGTSGYVGIVGQAHDIRSDWPRVQISNYTRTINYDAKSSFEDRTITQGNYPRIGGGGIPLQGEQRQQAYVVDKAAWTMQNGMAVAQPDAADVRAIDIWM